MKIKVTIKANSKTAKIFDEHMAEKKAFRGAVVAGKLAKYAKEKPSYFSIPS